MNVGEVSSRDYLLNISWPCDISGSCPNLQCLVLLIVIIVFESGSIQQTAQLCTEQPLHFCQISEWINSFILPFVNLGRNLNLFY